MNGRKKAHRSGRSVPLPVSREIADHRGFGMHMLSFERKCVIIRWEFPRFKHLFEAQEKSDRRRSAIQIRG